MSSAIELCSNRWKEQQLNIKGCGWSETAILISAFRAHTVFSSAKWVLRFQRTLSISGPWLSPMLRVVLYLRTISWEWCFSKVNQCLFSLPYLIVIKSDIVWEICTINDSDTDFGWPFWPISRSNPDKFIIICPGALVPWCPALQKNSWEGTSSKIIINWMLQSDWLLWSIHPGLKFPSNLPGFVGRLSRFPED